MVPLGLLQTERARRSLDEERRTYVRPGFDIDGRSCARRSAKSPPPYVIHVINFTRLPPFPACNIGKSRGAWEQGYLFSTTSVPPPLHFDHAWASSVHLSGNVCIRSLLRHTAQPSVWHFSTLAIVCSYSV